MLKLLQIFQGREEIEMPGEYTAEQVREHVEAIYRAESRRIFATLIRLLSDFDLAEDALQDAFRAAMEQWPRAGIPANPRAWLVSTGHFKAIDIISRRTRFDTPLDDRDEWLDHDASYALELSDEDITDGRLGIRFILA